MNDTPGDSMPEGPPAPPRQRMLPYSRLGPVFAGAFAGLALRLAFNGGGVHPYSPMLATFICGAPVLVAAITVYMAERMQRRSWEYYFLAGMLANVLFIAGTLVVMIEGIICAVLILPLFGVVGGLAGLGMGAICRFTNRPRRTLYSIVALPLLLGAFEQRIPLPQRVELIERRLLIDASPEKVWAVLETVRDIRPEEVGDAWMYRVGVPLPLSAVTEWTAQGPVRHVQMGKSIHFDQVAAQWQPLHRVRWTYRFTEDSVPARALDEHVRIGGEYFDLLDTEYELLAKGTQTELVIRMRYRVSTHFNWYARPLAAVLVGNFSEIILRFYGGRAVALNQD